MFKRATGAKLPKGLFSQFKGILNAEESAPTRLAFTAVSPLHRLPLFMPCSAASVRRRLLTLHATHSLTGLAYSNTPPGTAPRRDSFLRFQLFRQAL